MWQFRTDAHCLNSCISNLKQYGFLCSVKCISRIMIVLAQAIIQSFTLFDSNRPWIIHCMPVNITQVFFRPSGPRRHTTCVLTPTTRCTFVLNWNLLSAHAGAYIQQTGSTSDHGSWVCCVLNHFPTGPYCMAFHIFAVYWSPASVTNLLKQMKVEMMFLPHHHKTISRNFLFGMSTQGPQELTNELAPHMAEGQWVDCILVSCSL